ncbi:MAG: DUF3536 domain-containing protein [Gemmatimonadetes bacterium]|nr:DUF3536 domain-containing protein [Gemmatimonadota bacterium]
MRGSGAGYVCVHGHFYQPPRENPWLEAVERQPSAHPFHDWNQRITAECYAPNAASRILDGDGYIIEIVNNYAWMSFNVGPTLLAWLEEKAPDIYAAILDADRESAERFGGHGSAIAQAYNHMILPLARERDRRTQVRWGVRDFRHRFGRDPEGMWLPETAVDVASLETLAAEGILFTILAPGQIDAIRPLEGDAASWRPFREEQDVGRAYRVALPSGRDIAVFAYHGSLSRAVAFERLLSDGAAFARRLLDGIGGQGDEAPLVHIATDGETYGHHHRHGDMALAYALRHIVQQKGVDVVNYGQYLELHPPTWEARIVEDTSWSCAHGVERWRSDCGCSGGRGEGWHQRWRGPLREALDGLRDDLAPRYEWEAAKLLRDPWEARDRYIDVILDRSERSVDAFLESEQSRSLDQGERIRALRLLELQRHAQLMYTSCGWFFDDLSGIETVQVLEYAGRAIHLAHHLVQDEGIEAAFLERLTLAVSNVASAGTGRDVYLRTVEGSRVDRDKAGAHYAVSSLFEDFEASTRIYSFRFDREAEHRFEAGQASLLLGRVRVTSLITRAREDVIYGVLHLGHHNVTGGVRPYQGDEAYHDLVEEVSRPFLRTDLTSVIRVLDRAFGASIYSLRSLFRDAQRRIVDRILEASILEAESAFARLYEERAPLLRFLADLEIAQPRPFVVAAEYVLNIKLRRILAQEEPHLPAVRATLEEAGAAGVPLDLEAVAYSAQRALEREMARLLAEPEPRVRLQRVLEMTRVFQTSGLPVTLWRVQNLYVDLHRDAARPLAERAADGEAEAAAWLESFRELGDALRVAVPGPRALAGGQEPVRS